MYTIGQVSEMFNLPVSTLRYYDKEGLFPFMQRTSGIRQFSDTEIAALKLIECLKKSGLEIRNIKQFMEWCQEGSRTYELRKQLFERQKAAVEKEMEKMQETLDMLTFKCFYYEQAIKDGNEDGIHSMLPDKLPADIQTAYDLARKVGFDCINMDLIAGLPGDTVEGFEKSLRQAIALDPENITVHTLTLKRASRIVIEDQKENDYADVAAMLEKCHLLAEAGYRPYYLYRQKNTLQNLENVGWCKPSHEGYYNIYIMEEVQTILSAGAGGSTKLVADGGKRMQRIFNFKYPTEYIQRFDEVLERKKGVAVFYDHDLGTETSG